MYACDTPISLFALLLNNNVTMLSFILLASDQIIQLDIDHLTWKRGHVFLFGDRLFSSRAPIFYFF